MSKAISDSIGDLFAELTEFLVGGEILVLHAGLHPVLWSLDEISA